MTAAEEHLLCGREDVIAEVVANCESERHTVVSAEPGLGISSLFEAGLAPALQRAGYIVAVHRQWQGTAFSAEFVEAIAAAVREQADPQFYARENAPLDEMLRYIRLYTKRRVAVLLDQFEDYLRCQANSYQSDLIDAELGRMITQRDGRCIFGLQAHAIPSFERLRQHVPNLLGFHIQLQPLTKEAAAEAAKREAKSRGMEVEPAALEALLTSPVVARQDGLVNPFFLKTATERLLEWEFRAKSSVVRMETIQTFDGVDRVVLESLDPVLQALSVTHQDLVFRWFNFLVSADNARLSVSEKALTQYAGRMNRFVLTLLPALVEQGVLRRLQVKDTLRYEVAHQGLTPILRDWWERRDARIIARRRATFRVTSISVAIGAIVAIYVVWLIFSK